MDSVTNKTALMAAEIEAQGVQAYLAEQQSKGLLRLLTCGSVDDGKSTLIGRLLHDSAQIYEDQLASLKSDSVKMGTTGEAVDLALLVDGLQAEREQGITIDVAYRYFSSNKRKFIIADTPGHEQYTRNMATGASTCELAVILVDARYGVQTQTRRHAFIASLLGIRHFVVAINKMDLVGFEQAVFDNIVQEFNEFTAQLGKLDIQYVPVSALDGDNVVEPSRRAPWYKGKTLLEHLETVEPQQQVLAHAARLPVQLVSRPHLDFRGFAGTLASGILKVGDKVQSLPSGQQSQVARIVTFDGDLEQAVAGQAITVTLEDEIDVSRGDLLAVVDDENREQLNLATRVSADLVWMDEQELALNKLYDIKVAGKKTQAQIVKLEYLLDVNTLSKTSGDDITGAIGLNGIARVELELTEPVALSAYGDVKDTGAMILIDRLSNATVAALMVTQVHGNTESSHKDDFSEFELEFNRLVRKHFPHWQALDISQLGR